MWTGLNLGSTVDCVLIRSLGSDVSKKDDFFDAQREASFIKTRIVVDYFKPWARIMANVVRKNPKPRMYYVDLFSGPGRYDDGTPSTPVQIIQHAIETPDLCEMLHALFNDAEEDHIKALTKNLRELPGFDKLKNVPRGRAGEVDQAMVDRFKGKRLDPIFSFVDPFGYKGLTLDLVDALLKNWGSDMVLFFSFNSINRALTNLKVEGHINSLFGEAQAKELREAAKTVTAEKREELLIEKFIEAINDLGYDYVIPYMFEAAEKDRTSHYLIFISKNKRGFQIMKEIMYRESTEKIQGVAQFGRVKAVSKRRTPLLAFINTPLDDFCDQLSAEFAGQTTTRKEVRDRFDMTYSRNPFVDRNWRDAWFKMEDDGRLVAETPRDRRPKYKGGPTLSDKVRVTFRKEKK